MFSKLKLDLNSNCTFNALPSGLRRPFYGRKEGETMLLTWVKPKPHVRYQANLILNMFLIIHQITLPGYSNFGCRFGTLTVSTIPAKNLSMLLIITVVISVFEYQNNDNMNKFQYFM